MKGKIIFPHARQLMRTKGDEKPTEVEKLPPREDAGQTRDKLGEMAGVSGTARRPQSRP